MLQVTTLHALRQAFVTLQHTLDFHYRLGKQYDATILWSSLQRSELRNLPNCGGQHRSRSTGTFVKCCCTVGLQNVVEYTCVQTLGALSTHTPKPPHLPGMLLLLLQRHPAPGQEWRQGHLGGETGVGVGGGCQKGFTCSARRRRLLLHNIGGGGYAEQSTAERRSSHATTPQAEIRRCWNTTIVPQCIYGPSLNLRMYKRQQ